MIPAVAGEKLIALEQAALDAEGASRMATAAVATAQQKVPAAINRRDAASSLETRWTEQAALDAIEQRVAELQAEAATRRERAERARRVYVQCHGWLRRQGDNLVEAPPITLRATGDAAAEVERLRAEIADMKLQLSAVRSAPPPAAELEHQVERLVEQMAARGKPAVSVDRGVVAVHFGKVERPGFVRLADPVDVLCWLYRDDMTARLIAELPIDERSLASAEREQRVAALEAKIEQAERQEEGWIASGAGVDRRADASPNAILGVMRADQQRVAA